MIYSLEILIVMTIVGVIHLYVLDAIVRTRMKKQKRQLKKIMEK